MQVSCFFNYHIKFCQTVFDLHLVFMNHNFSQYPNNLFIYQYFSRSNILIIMIMTKNHFHLCNVLDDDTAGNPSGTHGCQNLVKVIRQCYVWPFIHNAVYRNQKPSSVLPVYYIIQCLKQIAVNHADQIIHTGVRIWNTAKQCHFFSPRYCISPVRLYKSDWRSVSD